MIFILFLITIVDSNKKVLVFVIPNNCPTGNDGLLKYRIEQWGVYKTMELNVGRDVNSEINPLMPFSNSRSHLTLTVADIPAYVSMAFGAKSVEHEIEFKIKGSQKTLNIIINWECFTMRILDCNSYRTTNEGTSSEQCHLLQFLKGQLQKPRRKLLFIPTQTKSMENTWLRHNSFVEFLKFKNSYTDDPVIALDLFQTDEIRFNYHQDFRVWKLTDDQLKKDALMVKNMNLEVHFVPFKKTFGRMITQKLEFIYFGTSEKCCEEIAMLEIAITDASDPPRILFQQKLETVAIGPVAHSFIIDVQILARASTPMKISSYISVLEPVKGFYTLEKHCLTLNNVLSLAELYKAGSVNDHNIVFRTHKKDKSETMDVTMVVYSTRKIIKYSACHIQMKQSSSCQRKPLIALSDNIVSFETQKSSGGSYIFKMDDRVLMIEFSEKKQIFDILHESGPIEFYAVVFIDGHQNDDKIVEMPIPEKITNVIEARKQEELKKSLSVAAEKGSE